MADSFDAFRYISYFQLRWRWVASGCVAALAVASLVSAILPRQYTATARIVIDFPAGSDLRSSMAISPIYLESLRTYESFASSDSLFQKAIDRFALRRQSGPATIESLKKRVLKIGILHNTRILEISATLPDPHKAQELAQFLAESTIELNRSLAAAGDQDLLRGVEQQATEIRQRLATTEAAWAHLLISEPTEELRTETENASDVRSNLSQQLANAEVEVADVAERAKHAQAAELPAIRNEEANARARLAQFHKQIDDIDARASQREKLLAARIGHRDALDAQRKADEAALSAVETRLRETRSEAGRRGERLIIIDPGIVPERPSSPNVPLNLVAAFLLGLVLPLLYLMLEMNLREHRARGRYTAVARHE